MKKLRPIFKIHGGKFYTSQWIISNLPNNYPQLTYIEGCGGAASVLLNKEVSIIEVYNDADPSIAGIIKELAFNSDDFIKSINGIEYSNESFNWAKSISNPITELVRRRMSRGGLGEAFSWSERLRGGEPGDLHAWKTFQKQLPLIAERLKNVLVRNESIIDLVLELDAENVLWYIDPPYLPETRSSKKVYNVEMVEDEHVELGEILNSAKGKVLLSGYQSRLYTKLYKNWNMECKSVANHSSQAKNKEKRIEVLWKNY